LSSADLESTVDAVEANLTVLGAERGGQAGGRSTRYAIVTQLVEPIS
jgi:hypothetical protein